MTSLLCCGLYYNILRVANEINICVRSSGDSSCGRLRVSMLRLGERNRRMASLGAGAPEDSIGMMAARADSRRMNVEADMSIDDTTNRLVYTSKKITDAAFTVFKELQEQRQLCDVTIRVGDHDFVAHRVVLAATSPYFRGMFTGVCVWKGRREVSRRKIW